MKFCRQGHALDKENLYVRPSGRNKPKECRKCRSVNRMMHHAEEKRRKRARAAEVTSPGVVLTFASFDDVPIGQAVMHA